MMTTKTLAAALVTAFTAIMLQAADFRTIAAPSAGTPDGLKCFSLYCHEGFKGTLDRVDIDGVHAFRFTMDEAISPAPNAQRVQLRMRVDAPIVAGTEYRLRFRYRTDRPAYFSFRCQQSAKPWETITEHAAGGAFCTTCWKQMDYCFTPYLDGEANSLWMPNFELGFLGKGNAIYFADVVLEALD